MLELGRGLDLGQEAVGAERRAEIRVKDLDRDVAVVADVAGEVYRRHPAGADLGIDPVAVGERDLEPAEELGHVGRL